MEAKEKMYFVRIKEGIYQQIIKLSKEEDRTITVVINRLLEEALQKRSK